jgi:hypothetical protein
MKNEKPSEASQLLSEIDDAKRLAEVSRQAFREAFPPSRVDEVMAEAFRKAEQKALAQEQQ